jgi:salicylate synthetase
MNMLRYHEMRSPQSWNPLAAAIRLCHAAPFRDYVLYEKDGAWHYAGGSVAQLRVNSREITVSWPGKSDRVRWSDNPLPLISAILADCPVDRWNAFGFTTFELSYFLHGLGKVNGSGMLAPPESGLPLVRLIVPHTEAVITATGVTVRSLSRTSAAECVALMEDPGPVADRDEFAVPIEDGRALYCDRVSAAIADIRAGLLEKVIVSRRVPIGTEIDMVATYRAGREANTPARSFLLRLDGFEAAGFCPETVVEVGHDGHVITQPLAGTRAFGRGADDDRALRAELCSDPKEVYEHAISMRTSWSELGSVCVPGSVRVDVPMEVKFRGTVQHLGSIVSGQLASERSALDALAAVYPAVTASGIPKAAACSLISRLEPVARGLYSGSVFRMDHAGGLDAALVLRSVYQSGGQAWLQAGAGIVGVSRPEREFIETCEKLASVAGHIVPTRVAEHSTPAVVGAESA